MTPARVHVFRAPHLDAPFCELAPTALCGAPLLGSAAAAQVAEVCELCPSCAQLAVPYRDDGEHELALDLGTMTISLVHFPGMAIIEREQRRRTLRDMMRRQNAEHFGQVPPVEDRDDD